MQRYDELNKDNFLLFAAENYDSRTAVALDTFYEDLGRFNHINRSLRRYAETNKINIHLVLNHIVILYNIFNDAATPMLFYKTNQKDWKVIVSFLRFINRLPPQMKEMDYDKYITETLECI
jgi:hypothetical protein